MNKKNIIAFSSKILNFAFLSFLLLSMLFTRPFVGLQYKSYRLGEVIILGSFIFAFVVLILFNKLNLSEYFESKTRNVYLFIILSFFILSIVSDSNFLDSYTFKTSSYVWTISILFLTIWIFKTFHFNYLNFVIFLPAPFLMYLFSTGHYPDFIINIFNEFSDKFNFLKASDIMLATICVNIFVKNIIKDKIYQFIYLTISISLVLPLLLFMSRGSFVGLLIFFIFELFYNRKFLRGNILKTFLISLLGIILFITSLIYIDYLYVNEETKSLQYNEVLLNPGNIISGSVNELALKQETRKVFLSFYIHYGRIESRDPTTNWRLDIWQDIIFDLAKENRLLTGYGYKEILPQMTDPTAPGRLGRDGLNENVHSYFINILARGGVLQLFAFLYFYYTIIKKWKRDSGNYKILGFLSPVLFCASLDIAMEGVQFPVLFFSTLGYILFNQKNEIEHTN